MNRRSRWAAALAALLVAAGLIAFGRTAPIRHLEKRLARTHAVRRDLHSARLTRLLARAGELVVQPPLATSEISRASTALETSEKSETSLPAETSATPDDPASCPDLELSGRQLPLGELPSSASAPSPWKTAGPPLVSLWLDPCRSARVHARPWKPGRETEETGWISFYEGGALRFATPAGIRIHGGASRKHPPYGYRLSFRSEHGSSGFPGELLSTALSAPLSRLIVAESDDQDRDGSLWSFPGDVAYDIGRALGAQVPFTRPVWVSVNGEPARIATIEEHIDSDYMLRHYGHDNFELVRGKRFENDPRSDNIAANQTWKSELAWIAGAPAPFTLRAANQRYDIDKLTTWLVTVLFCATGDLYQDAMYRDRTGGEIDGRWSWIHWDHDMSFRTPPLNSRFANKHDLLPYVLDGRRAIVAPQQALLLRLVQEDPAYSAEIIRRTTLALNHQITPAFLRALVEHYEKVAMELGIQDLHWVGRLQEFFDSRPGAVYAQLTKILDAGKPVAVELQAPPGTVRVDGFPLGSRYAGLYPAGQAIDAEVEPAARGRFIGWSIPGGDAASVSAPALHIVVARPMAIVANFRD
ncbi:MAG: CotH kinase family protein [Thermoanaerobaculia bacterium]